MHRRAASSDRQGGQLSGVNLHTALERVLLIHCCRASETFLVGPSGERQRSEGLVQLILQQRVGLYNRRGGWGGEMICPLYPIVEIIVDSQLTHA